MPVLFNAFIQSHLKFEYFLSQNCVFFVLLCYVFGVSYRNLICHGVLYSMNHCELSDWCFSRGDSFDGTTVGMASQSSMCTKDRSGGVNVVSVENG